MSNNTHIAYNSSKTNNFDKINNSSDNKYCYKLKGVTYYN